VDVGGEGGRGEGAGGAWKGKHKEWVGVVVFACGRLVGWWEDRGAEGKRAKA
jgi:hypothetical protein